MKNFLNKIKYGISRVLGFKPRSILNSKIDKKAKVGHGAQFVNSSIGKYSYVFESVVVNTEIGAFCSVASDCVIGSGAVIGMGRVATRDVSPYEIWVGNPARFIRKRLDDETVSKLSEVKWWDWDDKTLKENAEYFNTPEKL